jgi:hypothetical protein
MTAIFGNVTATTICEEVHDLVDPWLTPCLVRRHLLTHLAVLGEEVDDLVDGLGWEQLASVPLVPGLPTALLAGGLLSPPNQATVTKVVARWRLVGVRRVLVELAEQLFDLPGLRLA